VLGRGTEERANDLACRNDGLSIGLKACKVEKKSLVKKRAEGRANTEKEKEERGVGGEVTRVATKQGYFAAPVVRRNKGREKSSLRSGVSLLNRDYECFG